MELTNIIFSVVGITFSLLFITMLVSYLAYRMKQDSGSNYIPDTEVRSTEYEYQRPYKVYHPYSGIEDSVAGYQNSHDINRQMDSDYDSYQSDFTGLNNDLNFRQRSQEDQFGYPVYNSQGNTSRSGRYTVVQSRIPQEIFDSQYFAPKNWAESEYYHK